MKNNKKLTVVRVALWGGIVFGGLTLALILCDAYGPKGMAEGVYNRVGPVVNFVPNAAMHHLGYDLNPTPTVAVLHGSVFAATINFVVGAAITLFLAAGLRSMVKKR